MRRALASVGGWTLVSRVTGFARDVVMAATLGSGVAADAFVVALRLPNHFRAIFGEGAFNAAFVPAYAKARAASPGAGEALAARLLLVLLAAQLALLALAWAFMPAIVRLLAPGFADEPERFALAVTLTRITFPYLLFVTLVTLLAGMLNAAGRYAAGAAAPVLLNAGIVAALAMAWLFPSAGHAAAWGVALAGAAELALLLVAARRAGLLPRLRLARAADDKPFWRAFGPATLGSAGVQVATFADTILASLLPVGAVSAIYYADRLNQLPVGVVGIAAGTVLLAETARRVAAGDEAGARAAHADAVGLVLALALPFAVAFLILPDLSVRALFARGAFSPEAANAAGDVLRAYAVGLPAVVLVRAAVAPFQARGDTGTPMRVALGAIAVNIGLKVLLTPRLGAPGLALATSAGAWLNFGTLALLARRRGLTALGRNGRGLVGASLLGALALGLALWGGERALAGHAPGLRDEARLAALAALGLAAYAGGLLAGLGLTGARLRRG